MFLHAHAFDQFLHPVGTSFAHLIDYVAVFIQREGCGIVAHILLKGFDIVAGLEAVYCESVAKIVDPVMLQASQSHYLKRRYIEK